MFFIARTFSDGRHQTCGGVSCYGYDDNTPRILEFLKIDASSYDDFEVGGDQDENGNNIVLSCYRKEDIVEEFSIPCKGNEHLDSQYVGVTPELADKFIAWVESEYHGFSVDLQWIEAVKGANPLRFNQGDQFFTQKIENVELDKTSPGKAQGPIILKMLK